MYPFLKSGDLVLLKRVSGQLKKGDVTAFRTAGGSAVLHRVIRAGNGACLFADDNNCSTEHVDVNDLIGKMIAWYRAGRKHEINFFRKTVFSMKFS